MTHSAQMEQATEDIHSMFPDSGGMENMADPARALLEDYNRSMLQYTQRQMSSFVDTDDTRRSSQSSGQSGRSSASRGSSMSQQANPSFTSVSSAAHPVETKLSGRDMAAAKSAGY
ncbi:hypothetical protein PCH_Pc21g16150 [Penicillium rubens Wisconsin 54-1255]|uniref:Uncharacterized protein n=1 Tax=Penicillium rubens (strain ATCC 28089 / DSM 1075 / NRRL 1951 / Wisconsin 54-1255) TaxID=500485 RepID=B6HKL4_PENRW|nr:hypothetical protein PCH_Pc21g16150 [Penicillium rubens Wisconsin 54-1255]